MARPTCWPGGEALPVLPGSRTQSQSRTPSSGSSEPCYLMLRFSLPRRVHSCRRKRQSRLRRRSANLGGSWATAAGLQFLGRQLRGPQRTWQNSLPCFPLQPECGQADCCGSPEAPAQALLNCPAAKPCAQRFSDPPSGVIKSPPALALPRLERAGADAGTGSSAGQAASTAADREAATKG